MKNISFIFESDETIFYGKDDYEHDDYTEQDLLDSMLSKSKSLKDIMNDEQNMNNITNITETERGDIILDIKMKSDSNLPDKSNDELNETSFTLQNDHTEEEEVLYNKIDKNQIFAFGNLGTENTSLHHVTRSIDIFKIKKRNRKKNKLYRKNDPDTIRRKIKTNFHKYIIQTLNNKIKQLKLPSRIKKKKFLKFNNHVTSTVSIKFNKRLLEKTIRRILISEEISTKYKKYPKNNNASLISHIIKENNTEIKKILNMTYEDMFKQFLKSDWYKDLLTKIENKDGIEYSYKFNDIAQNMIPYFYLTDPKKKKNKHEYKKERKFSNDKCYVHVNNIFENYNYNDISTSYYNIYSKFNSKLDEVCGCYINILSTNFKEDSNQMEVDNEIYYFNLIKSDE